MKANILNPLKAKILMKIMRIGKKWMDYLEDRREDA